MPFNDSFNISLNKFAMHLMMKITELTIQMPNLVQFKTSQTKEFMVKYKTFQKRMVF